jgi:hypothetical protein
MVLFDVKLGCCVIYDDYQMIMLCLTYLWGSKIALSVEGWEIYKTNLE